jgi:3-oxoacyl-[acyl-carrier protein] reductase
MGAAGGLGRAVALTFADAGADVALTTATNDAEEAYELRLVGRAVTAKGRRTLEESVDMSIGASVQVAARQITKAFGPIDVLVVAPYAAIDKATERITDAEWSRLVGLNFSAFFYVFRGLGREMMSREGTETQGRMIAITAGRAGVATSAASAAVHGLVRGLADEWRGRVSINAIDAMAEAEAEVTYRALWLASDEAAGVSGEVFRVDAPR